MFRRRAGLNHPDGVLSQSAIGRAGKDKGRNDKTGEKRAHAISITYSQPRAISSSAR